MCANKRFSFYINKNYMMPFKLDKAKLTIGMTWCLFETKTELCFDVFQSTDKRCSDAKARAIGNAVSLFLLNLFKFFPAYSWVVQHDSKGYQVKVFGLSRNCYQSSRHESECIGCLQHGICPNFSSFVQIIKLLRSFSF